MEGRQSTIDASGPTKFGYFLVSSKILGFDFSFGWRTFRWNHAVLYPSEAISLLFTIYKIKNKKRERNIENYSSIGKHPVLAIIVYSCHTSHK
nr:MAG TPA: hypothetical protein [Caudoviricetes sp.]